MGIKSKYEVRQIQKEETYPWLLGKHYAKRIPSIMWSFGLYKKSILIGVCTYGMPTVKMNYGKCIFHNLKINTYELTRLVVNDDLQKNVLSFFVGSTIKFFDNPTCLVSFADPNAGHHGYIYQATNWLYTGNSVAGGKNAKYILNGKEYHGKTVDEKWLRNIGFKYDNKKTLKQNWVDCGGIVEDHKLYKYRYIFLKGSKKQKSDMLKNLKYNIEPYPKGDNQRYDTSFKPGIQGLLF